MKFDIIWSARLFYWDFSGRFGSFFLKDFECYKFFAVRCFSWPSNWQCLNTGVVGRRRGVGGSCLPLIFGVSENCGKTCSSCRKFCVQKCKTWFCDPNFGISEQN